METISHQQLCEELDRTRRDLSILYEISHAMRTTLELQHILYIILTGVTSHKGLGFNRAVLFLVNSKERCLEPKMAIGPDSGEQAQEIWEFVTHMDQNLEELADEGKISQNVQSSTLLKSLKNLKIPLSTDENNLLANAYHLGAPMHLNSKQIQEYANDITLKAFPTKEIVIIPLKAKDKVNGLIIADNLYTQKSVTERDIKIFMMLAHQAGLAIENSHLYEKIKQQSHTDSLTSLWNHGYFQQKLTEEILTTTLTKKTLGLMLIDIDNFKNLNDTLGHQEGDLILRETARIIKEFSRDIDYVCRYGGEEFSLILPETTKEQAIAIAERICSEISNFTFTTNQGQKPLHVTVSIGVTCFPNDADSKERLISIADKAMYTAKFSGKNQVVAHSL